MPVRVEVSRRGVGGDEHGATRYAETKVLDVESSAMKRAITGSFSIIVSACLMPSSEMNHRAN